MTTFDIVVLTPIAVVDVITFGLILVNLGSKISTKLSSLRRSGSRRTHGYLKKRSSDHPSRRNRHDPGHNEREKTVNKWDRIV